MKLTHLLSKSVVIARYRSTSGDKIAFSTVTSAKVHIQPMSNEKNSLDTGVWGKTYRIYTDGDMDIEEGDRLRDCNNNIYTVKAGGVSRRTFGSFDYLIIIAEME